MLIIKKILSKLKKFTIHWTNKYILTQTLLDACLVRLLL